VRYLAVDRLLALDPGVSAQAIRNVTLTEDVFATHFPHFPVLPGVLVTDTIAKVAEWAITSQFRLARGARLVALRGAKFRHFVRPGDQLLVQVTHRGTAADRQVWKATATVERKRIASIDELEFVVGPLPDAELEHERRRFGWAGGWALLDDREQPRRAGTP